LAYITIVGAQLVAKHLNDGEKLFAMAKQLAESNDFASAALVGLASVQKSKPYEFVIDLFALFKTF